jgi:type III pantothenate kinase
VILALDIGNSATKAALFDGEVLVRADRLASIDEAALRDFVGGVSLRCVGIASVVPERTPWAVAASRAISATPPVVVSAELRLPFAMAYRTPATLGADRLAAAAGAVALLPEADPLVAIDAGTAMTFEVVANGAYRGGVITAGPDLLRRCLAAGTAQLPEAPAELPSFVIGGSTLEALQAGVMWGVVETARGILERMARELGRQPVAVATGGWAPLLAEHVPGVSLVEPHLVLHGVRALLALNA